MPRHDIVIGRHAVMREKKVEADDVVETEEHGQQEEGGDDEEGEDRCEGSRTRNIRLLIYLQYF